ncbi:thioesterase [Microbispora rosea subsp. aerata]|nr:thioesterase family protein [Microbispora rosea]GGO00206.1 thioesterase [Microbispora rosea subsp. aerata]GIH56780.1 thioesterase [Microbispora rosea subsp. aerata]GLJ84264.1 thioesterase [Microbispora rosea subsp. aerata]
MTELRNHPDQVTRYVFERKVRFGDIDSLGHVNNVRFFDYLEDARVAMLWDRPREVTDRRQDLVVARHEIDYRWPLTFRTDPVRVEVWVTELSRVRFTLAYEIRDDETLYVEAKTVMVAYDAAAARPRRLDEDELAYLKRFCALS